MKKIASLFVALFTVVAFASAQKGEKSIGLSLGYGTEIESLGIGARFQYGLTDRIRLAPEFVYYLPSNNLNMWDINLNAHYLFPVQDKLSVYPLAGLIVSHVGWDYDLNVVVPGVGEIDNSETNFGINLGGGVQYDFTETLSFFGELKYSLVSDFDQAVISAGIAYKF